MTDAQLVKLLEAIKGMALLPYPWPEEARVTDNAVLVMALGEIAGVAQKALDKYRATQ